MFLGVLRWPTTNLKSETFVHKNRRKFFPQESFLKESFKFLGKWKMRRVKWRRSHQSSKWLKLSEIRQKILNFDEFTFFPDIISFFKVKKNYFLFLDFQNSQILKFLMYNLGKKPKKNVGMLDPDSGLFKKMKMKLRLFNFGVKIV